MALVDSLLSAIVRADGDALVMHVGERPYVVVGAQTIHISTHDLNLEAMTGMLGELLPQEVHKQLEEFGAVEHKMPAATDDQFNVVAARGGEDIWIEIRRRRAESPVAASESLTDESQTALAEAERLEAERLEMERLQAEQLEIERLEAERLEAERREAARLEAERLAAELGEAERIEAERLEAQRREAERLEAEWLETERVEAERQEAARLEAKRVEAERREAERLEAEHVEAERVEAERQEAARLEAERVEAERREAERLEAERVEAARLEAERLEAERVEAERVEAERVEAEHLEAERREAARAEAERLEAERLEAERLEAERREAARAEAERLDAERREAERLEAERLEVELREAARVQAERLEAERREAERRDAERREDEQTVAARVELPAAEIAAFASAAESSGVLPLTRTVRIEVPPRAAASTTSVSDAQRLVKAASLRGATAVFITPGTRPFVRVEGDMRSLDSEPTLSRADVERIISQLTPIGDDATLKGEPGEWAAELDDVGPVRCSTFVDHRGPGIVVRLISTRAATAEQLGLSRDIQTLATEPEGLVLVTGPRGGGRSTLLSAFVDLVNRQRAEYVISLERDVNLVHENQAALVSQREVRGGADEALKALSLALRENPDVLVVDDLLSAAMVPMLLDAASKGVLVLVTLPAGSTSEAVRHFIDMASPEVRSSVQAAMGESFRGAIAQVVLKKAGGGRVAGREILVATAHTSRLISDGQAGQLPLAIEEGGKHGMASFTSVLTELVRSGAVDVREAFRKAPNRQLLLESLKKIGVDTAVIDRLI